MLKKTFPYLLILMFLLVLIGCNGSQITSPDTTPDNTPNQEITLEEEESIEISATEDTKISLQDGLEVEIKGNTLNGDTTLYIAKVALSKARANANLALLSLYEVAFIGDDISLNDAVTLKFPVPSGLTEDEIIIGHFHGNQTDMIEGYLSSGKYVIEVSEFSKFGVYSKDTTDEVSTQDLNDETSDYLSASWWPAPEPPVFTTQSGSWFDCDEEYRIEWEDSFWKPVIKYDIQAYYGSFDENENPDKKDDTWSGYYDFYYSPDPDDPHAMGSKHIYYRIRSRNTLTQAESDWTDPIEIHLDDEPPPNLTISDHEVEIGEKYSLNWNVPSCTARYEIWEISKLNNGDISTDYIEVDSKGEVILDDYDSTVAGTIIYAIQFYNDGMTLSLSKNDPGTYYYSIRADYGNYDYSDWYVDPPNSGNIWVEVTRDDDAALPVPTGVDASDGDVAKNVYVTWDPVPGATHYKVYRAEPPNGTIKDLTDWKEMEYYADFDIIPGQHYFYYVKAASSSSGANESPFSQSDEGWTEKSDNDEEAINNWLDDHAAAWLAYDADQIAALISFPFIIKNYNCDSNSSYSENEYKNYLTEIFTDLIIYEFSYQNNDITFEDGNTEAVVYSDKFIKCYREDQYFDELNKIYFHLIKTQNGWKADEYRILSTISYN
jgi:hypothetical protein